MIKNKDAQFVHFETELDSDQFVKRWKQYTRSLNTDVKVVLQQSGKPGAYQYIAQHFIEGAELQFIFSREEPRSKVARARIKTSQAGGYHLTKKGNHDAGSKTKVFAFIKNPAADMHMYTGLSAYSKPNIWEAYYQNCSFAYILEYFISHHYAEELLDQLKEHKVDESGIYKEFTYKNDINYNDIRKDYVWRK
jgi:hypothetical protein